MSNSSLNLTARDFDAYLPEKATSNAYSRPRLEVKQRAIAWARRVVERLAAIGIAVDMHASDEHPSLRNKKRVDCQWVFFWRDHDAREELDRLLEQGRSISAAIDDPSPYTRHAFLALRLDPERVEVCFAVHPEAKVDVDNLRARLAASGNDGETPLAAEFTNALRALPEQFAIGLNHDEREPCDTTTAEAIVSMLERAADGQKPLWIGWSLPRETALAHADVIDEQLEDALVAIAPIYRLVAWSRENDHIALDRRIEGLEQAKARTHAEALAQNEKWRAEQEALRDKSQREAQARVEARVENDSGAARWPLPSARPAPEKSRRPSLDNLFKPRGNKPEASAPKAEAKRDARPNAHAEAKPRPSPEPAAEAKDAHSESRAPVSTVIEKGARVCVMKGAFAGKVGVISELDGRGSARVLLGLLSTRLDVTDLELCKDGGSARTSQATPSSAPTDDRERPASATSNRRPAQPAPRKTR